MSAPSPAQTKPLALVTGASRGIGRAAALRLAQDGFHILALARTVGGLEDLDDAIRVAGGSSTLVPVDLRDVEGLTRLGLAISNRWERLDALVHAGAVLGELMPAAQMDGPSFDEVMGVNVRGALNIIQLADPFLRQAPAGRAVMISSGAARKHKPFWSAYAASKAALETLTLTWAEELSPTPVCVNLLDPGPVATVMRAKAMPGEDPASITQPHEVAELIAAMCAPAWTERGGLTRYADWKDARSG